MRAWASRDKEAISDERVETFRKDFALRQQPRQVCNTIDPPSTAPHTNVHLGEADRQSGRFALVPEPWANERLGTVPPLPKGVSRLLFPANTRIGGRPPRPFEWCGSRDPRAKAVSPALPRAAPACLRWKDSGLPPHRPR